MIALADHRRPWLIGPAPSETLSSDRDWLLRLIGHPPAAVASELKSRDFLFLTKDAIASRAETIASAEALIDRIPSLSRVVRAIVREVFVLGAREEYDISHSEPRWPGWVFVSAPTGGCPTAGIRLAENIVHEAMHLQLTELEKRAPLVEYGGATLYSPWKQEPRDLQGILHGLYVFVCISAFLAALLESGRISETEATHMRWRIIGIREEVDSVPLDRLAAGLTPNGRTFLASIAA